MNSAFAGKVVNKTQQIIIDTSGGGDPSWQDQAMSALQSTVGPWGITALVVVALAGAGFVGYKKFKK